MCKHVTYIFKLRTHSNHIHTINLSNYLPTSSLGNIRLSITLFKSIRDKSPSVLNSYLVCERLIKTFAGHHFFIVKLQSRQFIYPKSHILINPPRKYLIPALVLKPRNLVAEIFRFWHIFLNMINNLLSNSIQFKR